MNAMLCPFLLCNIDGIRLEEKTIAPHWATGRLFIVHHAAKFHIIELWGGSTIDQFLPYHASFVEQQMNESRQRTPKTKYQPSTLQLVFAFDIGKRAHTTIISFINGIVK